MSERKYTINHSNIGNYLVYDMLEVVVNARVSQLGISNFSQISISTGREKEKDVCLKTLKDSNLFKTYNLLAVDGRMF